MSAAVDTRSRILDTARGLFHGRSYADVGIKEICEAAKVQKGSFYHFFPSKQDLALAVIDDMADEWAHGIVAKAFDPTLPPLTRMDRLIDAAYRWQKDVAATTPEGRIPGCLFGNLALEVSTHDEVLRTKLGTVFQKAGERFYETLDDAIEHGDIEPLDIQATAQAMLAYLEGVILLAKANNDPNIIRTLGPTIKTLRVERSDEASVKFS